MRIIIGEKKIRKLYDLKNYECRTNKNHVMFTTNHMSHQKEKILLSLGNGGRLLVFTCIQKKKKIKLPNNKISVGRN